ncbi:MAG: hypothetical protein M1820_006109 [Bogoriella megaspora]|nr:MAG: hypothetical protein M1820_006109 [Bogoriella megaspora]
MAASDNDPFRLQQLLEKKRSNQGLQTSVKGGQDSETALQRACKIAARNDDPRSLRVLLDEGCGIQRGTISAAAYSGSIEIFELFLEYGWDVNESLGHPGDALLMAIGAEKVNLVQWLLAHGADPNMNLRGASYTAIECAALTTSIPLLEALINAGAQVQGHSALQIAARGGSTEVVAYLLERGAAIDETPDDYAGVGNALCEAASEGRTEVAKLLLEKGANIEAKNPSGKTALNVAEANGHTACVDVLNTAYVRNKAG